MSDRRQTHEIEIDADREAVWRAITDAEELTRWYVEAARVVPGEGGTQWVSWGQGVEMVTRHEVWTPGERLVLAAPEGVERTGWNAIVLDYTLSTRHGKTTLRLVQSGMPEGPKWDGAYEGTDVGWRMFLTALKFYLERHAGRPRRTVQRSGHVPGSRLEVWHRLLGEALVGAPASIERRAAGDPYEARAVTGETLAGELWLLAPGRNFTASVAGWGEGLLQLDVSGGDARCYVNVVLSTFSRPDDEHAALGTRWTPHLESLVDAGG